MFKCGNRIINYNQLRPFFNKKTYYLTRINMIFFSVFVFFVRLIIELDIHICNRWIESKDCFVDVMIGVNNKRKLNIRVGRDLETEWTQIGWYYTTSWSSRSHCSMFNWVRLRSLETARRLSLVYRLRQAIGEWYLFSIVGLWLRSIRLFLNTILHRYENFIVYIY